MQAAFSRENCVRLRGQMMKNLEQDWLQGRITLGTASQWTPDEIRLVAELGYALAEQGRNAEAITIFEGLASLTPATAYFQSVLGALWLREKEPETALPYLDAAVAADPGDVTSLINRGEVYVQLNNLRAAERDLQSVIEIADSTKQPLAEKCATRARGLLARFGGFAEIKT